VITTVLADFEEADLKLIKLSEQVLVHVVQLGGNRLSLPVPAHKLLFLLCKGPVFLFYFQILPLALLEYPLQIIGHSYL
jgi:hypothetical protein